ncbi:MAG: DUF502 domain-containing protein, partial [Coxiellaceae bacterium]|nr:DUF502 domain-containing protein [Coxiellaceae bacterium]
DLLLGFHVPGVGLVMAIVAFFITGMMVTNFIGHRLVNLWERLLSKIPLVRTIHHAVKQVASSFLSSSEESFTNVLLIEYPRPGIYSIALQTSTGFQRAKSATSEELITVFLPTTPNPTSGFLLLVPKKDVQKLDMSVDEAFKMVISLGVVLPDRPE